MKILIVTPYFYPSVGGVQNYVLNMVRGLKNDHGHKIVIVTTNHETNKFEKKFFEGMTLYRLPSLFKLSNTPINPMWRRSIKKIIKYEKPDVINGYTPVPYLADIACRAKGKVPFILTYNNDLTKPNYMGKMLSKLFYILLSNRTLKLSDSIVALSEHYVDQSQYLKKYSYKISIVPPGVDLKRFNENVDKTILKKKYPKKKVILIVASMSKTHTHKGINTLIHSVALIKKTVPNIQLVAVGEGDAIPLYKKLALELGIVDAIDFPGFVLDKDLPSYYAGAEVFALPTINDSEGFGMVLIESQACGTPVVASNVGGIPTALSDKVTGFLVEPGSASELESAILCVLTDLKLSKHLGKAGIQFASANFSWDHQVAKLEKVYELTAANIIVQITPSYPPALGGMELRIRDLSQKLATNGHRVLVLTSDKATYAHQEIDDNLRVEYLPSKHLASTPIIPKLLPSLLNLPKNSILHVHVAQAFTPEIAYLAAKIKKIPIIFHIRLDVQSSSVLGFLLIPYKKLFLGPMLRRANKIIVLNDDYQKFMISNYKVDPAKVEIIPNATDFPIEASNNKFIKTPRKLLLVGRLAKQKNIPLAINTLARLIKQGYSLELDVVGDGDELTNLKSLVSELNISHYVHFLGQLDNPMLQKIYSNADIVIQTSFEEGFSSVLIEAMASGKPIIATDIQGTRNVIKSGYNGLLIDPRSKNSLTRALQSLIDKPSLINNLVKNGLIAVKKYKWEEVIKSTEQVYEDVSA